jgi:hypothetical protein
VVEYCAATDVNVQNTKSMTNRESSVEADPVAKSKSLGSDDFKTLTWIPSV